jgi:hypothetical protein
MLQQGALVSDHLTNKLDPNQAWEGVWNELRTVGITQGEVGPVDGNISCGRNAERAILGLQLAKLNAIDVQNVGMLIQAAIHAAGLYRKKPTA